MSGFQEMGFDENDRDVLKSDDRFKVSDDTSYRVSLAWWHQKEDGSFDFARGPRFLSCKRHYVEKKGYFLRTGKDSDALLGKAKPTVATLIVVWPTKGKGELDVENIKTGFQVRPWIMGGDKYSQIKDALAEFDLSQFDLGIYCPPEGSGFQKMTFTLKPKSVLAAVESNPDLADVLDMIKTDISEFQGGLPGHLGQVVSFEDLKTLVNGGTIAPRKTGKRATVDTDVESAINDLIS